MCELFAMSSRLPATVGFSLERLSRHGGDTGPHRDGWGVAFYDGPDIRLLREPEAASDSPLVRFIERHPPASGLVISHIRKATHGAVALRNTQPIAREMGGRMHVFAHNGDLPGITELAGFTLGRFHPLGETDSEFAFCVLMARMQRLWEAADGVPPLEARFETVAALASELRPLGPANFLYADSEVLFAHGHRRHHDDDSVRPPGLHLLCRRCTQPAATIAVDGATVAPAEQEVVLIASVPLTDEVWSPFAEGELAALAGGRTLRREVP